MQKISTTGGVYTPHTSLTAGEECTPASICLFVQDLSVLQGDSTDSLWGAGKKSRPGEWNGGSGYPKNPLCKPPFVMPPKGNSSAGGQGGQLRCDDALGWWLDQKGRAGDAQAHSMS